MIAQLPKLLLPKLNHALRQLRGACCIMNDGSSASTQKLLAVMRKLLLAEVLGGDQWIVAVGGSQGAGKTTLMTSLYDLQTEDGNWLQGNEGRGEKMPVLIIENETCQTPKGYVRKLTETGTGFELKEISVSIEDFQNVVRNPVPEDLLPVLHVPRRYFTHPHQAWLLLPGYEKQDRNNREWQQLMRQAMLAAGGCIIVTDEMRLANQQQLEIVRDMLENELEGHQPCIVISKTEKRRHDPEYLAELRANAQNTFKIAPELAPSRIICSGAGDAEYAKEWIPRLQAFIDDLNAGGATNRRTHSAHLARILEKDLASTLNGIRSDAFRFSAREKAGEDGETIIEDILQEFDDAVEKLREQHRNKVAELLLDIRGKVPEKIDRALADNHEGFLNWLGNRFNTTSETAQKMRTLVETAWQDATKNRKGQDLNEQYAALLRNIIKHNLGWQEQKPEMASIPVSDVEALPHASAARSIAPFRKLDEHAINNILVLFNRKQGETKGSLTSGVALIPTMALGYAELSYANWKAVKEKMPDDFEENQHDETQSDFVEKGVEHLGHGVELGQTAIRSIAAVLAVDVASDGDSDILKLLTEDSDSAGPDSVISSASAVPLMQHPVAIAASAAVAAVYVVARSISGLRRAEQKARNQAYSMLNGVHDSYLDHFQEGFDKLMAKTRAEIRENLRERYHIGENLMRKDKLAKAIADARSIADDLRDALGSSAAGLQLFSPDADD